MLALGAGGTVTVLVMLAISTGWDNGSRGVDITGGAREEEPTKKVGGGNK